MKDSFVELRVICQTVKEWCSWLTNHIILWFIWTRYERSKQTY
jgi:hypothetical protein